MIPPHLRWLINTSRTLTTSDGKTIELWEFNHQEDDTILSDWARHFRNHYCEDSEIDSLRAGTGLCRSDYLTELVFPDCSHPPGPSIRAGDFCEILLADYLEFRLGYWVPRLKYNEKAARNESTKGADILGFKITDGEESPEDILATFEAKAKLTGRPANRLQSAVTDSVKDLDLCG